MVRLLAMSLFCALSSAPVWAADGSAEEAEDDEADEVIEVWSLKQARQRVEGSLERKGYTRQSRRSGKTIYRSTQRWKPAVVVYDDGFVMVRDPVVRGRAFVVPGFLGAFGTITSQRKVDAAKADVLASIDPYMRDWQEALRSEIAVDAEFEAPEGTVPTKDYGHVVRAYVGSLTGQEPWDLEEDPILGLLGTPREFDPDEQEALSAYDASLRGLLEGGGLGLQVINAMSASPRHAYLEHRQWDLAGLLGPIELDDGYVAGILSLAWQLTVAGPVDGQLVLELGKEVGWRKDVLEELGAKVVDDLAPHEAADLILMDEGAGEAALLATRLMPEGRLLEVHSHKLVRHDERGSWTVPILR